MLIDATAMEPIFEREIQRRSLYYDRSYGSVAKFLYLKTNYFRSLLYLLIECEKGERVQPNNVSKPENSKWSDLKKN
jgi:hypothetical protein